MRFFYFNTNLIGDITNIITAQYNHILLNISKFHLWLSDLLIKYVKTETWKLSDFFPLKKTNLFPHELVAFLISVTKYMPISSWKEERFLLAHSMRKNLSLWAVLVMRVAWSYQEVDWTINLNGWTPLVFHIL